jgi:DNA-binding IclR family transcriptional regulator
MPISTSVERTIDVLELLSEGRELTLSECSGMLEIPKSTLSGLLRTLHRRGYITKRRDGRFALGVGCLQLGKAFLDGVDVRSVALPIMREISARTHHTSSLCVVDSDLAAIVATVDGATPFRVLTRKTAYAELHSTAVGKCLLSGFDDEELDRYIRHHGLPRLTRNTIISPPDLRKHLKEVRSRGYAVDNEEEVEGVRCVGVPILNHAGDVVASLSVSALAPQIDSKAIPELAEILKEASGEISSQMGFGHTGVKAEISYSAASN